MSALQEVAVDPSLYEGYAIDLDGTMYLGVELLPGAAATIAALRALDRRIVYLSNKPLDTREHYAELLTRLGVPTRPEAIVNSSGVMVEYLQQCHPGARLFVIGEAPFQDELRRGGCRLTEDPGRTDVVVAAFDRTFDYRKLQIAFDAIRGGARLVATNPDPYCPVPGGGLPDCGAITAAIEAATGVRADAVVGKPSETMARAALSRLGVRPAEAIVVGDRLDTDVAMGVRAGMHTALVLTGATRREHIAASSVRPEFVLEDLRGLLPRA
ncbi:MAG TPA: HAD-IIA family hydrolase [bacterium]|nr:HAD-IIA family hydrolase [bacterium]